MSVVTTSRRLLIVGGGIENEARVAHALLFDWYAIRFVARRVPSTVRDLAANDSRFTFEERDVTEDDIRHADLVFEDSGDRELAERIAGWCRAHRVPINATDKPELCDLFYSALLVRDPLVVSISSGGDAPAVSSILRRWLEERIGPGWSTAARVLSDARRRLPSGQARMNMLKQLARNAEFQALIEKNDEVGMRTMVEHAIRCLPA